MTHVARPSQSLKYLGATCGSNIKTAKKWQLIVTTELRISYSKVASLKFSLNRKILSRIYSAVALPVIYYVFPMWKWLSITDKLKIRTAFFQILEVSPPTPSSYQK